MFNQEYLLLITIMITLLFISAFTHQSKKAGRKFDRMTPYIGKTGQKVWLDEVVTIGLMCDVIILMIITIITLIILL